MPTPSDEATEPAAVAEPAAEAEPAAVSSSAAPARGPEADEADEDPFPPALIVGLRAPDRAVARTIGLITPEQARLGASITFGISGRGRSAERKAVAQAPRHDAAPNVLSRPHPRLSVLPTRIATSTSFEVGESSDDP